MFYFRQLRPSDLPTLLRLSDEFFPQIDPRRAGLERVFDNPDACALVAVDGGGAIVADGAAAATTSTATTDATSDPGPDRIAAFVIAIVGAAEPGGARDGGSTAAQDYEHIRRAVLDAASHPNSSLVREPAALVGVRAARAGAPFPTGCIALLGVAPRYRRRGLAARLMSGAANFCVAKGAAALYLHTPAGNAPAVALYERRLGFQRAAFLPGYYEGCKRGTGATPAAGTDALLFVRPVVGGAASLPSSSQPPHRRQQQQQQQQRQQPHGRPPAWRALPCMLSLPGAAGPQRDAPVEPLPVAADTFRVDEETGEVALVDQEEEEDDGENRERRAGARGPLRPLPPPPPSRLLGRIAAALLLRPARPPRPPRALRSRLL